jgi:osmotically-inducible protein OsmY
MDPHTLIDDVVDAFRGDPRIDAGRIAIAASDGGTVVLNGVVGTLAEKRRAEEIAATLDGVTSVRNQLEVRLTIGDYRTDECLCRVTNDVIEALAGLPPERPHATVNNGWVTLVGRVRWRFQKRMIEDLLTQIAGIRGISNEIAVAEP